MAYSGNSGHSAPRRSAPRTESEQPFVIRLTPDIHSRLVQFFNRRENAGLRQSDVFETLLNATESADLNIRHGSPPFGSPVLRRGLVTSVPAQQALPKRIAASETTTDHPEEEDEDFDDDEQDEMDEELNYGDEYLYEEVVEPNDTSSGLAASERNVSAIHNYYATPVAKQATKRRAMPAERRSKEKAGDSATKVRKQYHPDRKGVGTGKQKPWTSNLRRIIYELITKWQRDYLLHCRECDRWMKVAHSRSGLRCGNVLDHVCSHIGKPMYACRLCPQQTVTSVQMRKHLQKVHDRTNDFDDLTESCYSELEERIMRCFDYSDQGSPPNGQKRLLTCKRKRGEVGVGQSFLNQEMDMETSSVRRYIYDLIMKWQQENAVYCRNCNHWIRVGAESAWAQTQSGLAHICGHFGKDLYACLICNDRTNTYYQMIRHIRHVHQTISRGNCVEFIEEFATDLKQLAAAYFDWEEGTEPPELTADGPFLKKRRTSTVRRNSQNPTRSNSARAEILDYSRHLIRDIAGNPRAMECRKCGTTSMVSGKKGPRPDVLIDHALKHVQKNAYECAICGKVAKRKDGMRLHMLNHKGAKTTDFFDKTDEIRDDIVEMMKQCYDTTGSEEAGEQQPAGDADDSSADPVAVDVVEG